MKKVVVVGGGAAGMVASIIAAMQGSDVVLLEQNEKLGKKIYITGKGRCNLTNAVSIDEFMKSIFRGGKFAYSCLYAMDPFQLIDFLSRGGLQVKTERGNRVFPISDKASDVTKALTKLMDEYGVTYQLNTKVEKINTSNGKITGVSIREGGKIDADSVILCCGGKSYAATGSDGNGYILSSDLGHTIIDPLPALVPLNTNETWVHRLAGLSLKNVQLSLYRDDKLVASEFGEMLFTHKGLSGPVVLTLSCHIEPGKRYKILIDLKPALDEQTLERRILREFESAPNKTYRHALDPLLPRSLASEVITLTKINPDKKINQVTISERKVILSFLKGLRINIEATAGFQEAIITKGGVSLKEINSSTMGSKLIEGLYFAGEMIDLHAYTGGFNLQLAFSTGFLAGLNA